MDIHSPEIDSLQTRVARLEKENRRFKHLGLAMLAGIGLLFAMAQAPARKTVEATEFVVKDAHGNTRIRLGVDPKNDSADLWLQTAKGEEGASLSDSGLILQQGGVVRTVLDGGDLSLANTQGQANVKLSAADNAERDLSIEGPNGYLFYKPGEALQVSDIDGYMASIGATEVRGVGGATTHTNAASVVLTNPDSQVLWKAP